MLKINSYYEYHRDTRLDLQGIYFRVIKKLTGTQMEILWSDDWGIDVIDEKVDETIVCFESTESEFLLSKIK